MRTTLGQLKAGELFMRPGSDIVWESRGNCWFGVYNESYNGGPWFADAETPVDVEPPTPTHPSQQLSCFV